MEQIRSTFLKSVHYGGGGKRRKSAREELSKESERERETA